MTTESTPIEHVHPEPKEMHHGGGGGGSSPIYGIGLIGAWVYYFKGVTTFQQGITAFFKGLVWPAFLVHDLLVFLKKE